MHMHSYVHIHTHTHTHTHTHAHTYTHTHTQTHTLTHIVKTTSLTSIHFIIIFFCPVLIRSPHEPRSVQTT